MEIMAAKIGVNPNSLSTLQYNSLLQQSRALLLVVHAALQSTDGCMITNVYCMVK